MSEINNGTVKKGSVITTPNKPVYLILLACIILALIGANVYWETHNTTPPPWDQATYLETAANFSNSLVTYGPVNLLRVFSGSLGTKAPLIALLPLPAFVIFGPDAATALLFMNFLVILMNVFLFFLFKEISDRRTALLGVVLTASMPLIYGLSRQFLVEYSLTVIVVMWMYFLITSDHLQKNMNNFALGLLFGLGLLMKVTFPMYVLAPTAIVFIQRLRIYGFRKWKRLVIDICMILIPGIALASIWYVHNLSSVISFGLSSGFGSTAEMYSSGLWQYWGGVIYAGTSAYLFLCLVTLAALVFARRPGKVMNIFAAERTSLYVLASWFIVPFFILSVGVNSDARYITPALPVVGLIIAYLFFQAVPKKAVLPAVLLCAIPIFNLIYTTFPLGERVIQLNDFSLVSYQWGVQTYRPVDENWRVTDVMADINADARGQKKKVTMVIDHMYYNMSTFEYYRYLNSFPFQLAKIAYLPSDTTTAQIYKDLSQVDYIVAKTGEQGPDFSNYRNAEIRDDLMKENSVFSLLKEYGLPDGSIALLYKHR